MKRRHVNFPRFAVNNHMARMTTNYRGGIRR